MLSRKFWLVLYLAVWSTAAARLSFEFVYLLVPKRGDMAAAAEVVPFIAFPVSLGIALRLLRGSQFDVWAILTRYIWIAPVLLYFALLCTVAAMAGSASPVAIPFVLVVGFFFGLPALVMGIPIHALGIVPLYLFRSHLEPAAPKRGLATNGEPR